MKTVGFIGGYDKLDLILYIARILTLTNKKVLVIDATTLQKTKYTIPAINPTQSYITEFEGFDVAVGFKDINELINYVGTDYGTLNYDMVLIDVDTKEAAINFRIDKNQVNCFVTAFDLYSIKKGVEILSAFEKPVKLIKVFFSKNFIKEENEYLDYLSLGYKVVWDKEIISFPVEIGNYSVTIQNQIISRIKIKKLSTHYKNSLIYLISMLFNDEINQEELKRIVKTIERV